MPSPLYRKISGREGVKLNDIATIQTGYTLRGRLEPIERGGLPVIQMGDVSQRGIDTSKLSKMAGDGLADRYLVRSGDVLFRPRGDRTTACALGPELNEPAVALLPLIVIRPNRDVVTAAFLAWALNQPPAQQHFDASARGTSMRMVPKSSLDTLDLDVPPLAVQRLITEVDALAGRERMLVELMVEKREKLLSRLLAQAASRQSMKPGQ